MLGASRRASEGLGGLGLLAPVPVPVGVLVWALGVLNAFLGDPSGIRPQILGALREANLDCGAGGFFVGGAVEHARSIAHRPLGCKGCGGSLFEFLSGAYISPQPADASQSLSASQSSRVMLPQASANA